MSPVSPRETAVAAAMARVADARAQALQVDALQEGATAGLPIPEAPARAAVLPVPVALEGVRDRVFYISKFSLCKLYMSF